MGRTYRKRRRNKSNLIVNCEDNNVINKLCQYLGSYGWQNDTALTCREFCGIGRGLCSKKNIETGQLLLKLPFKALITLRTLEDDPQFIELFTKPLEKVITFQALLAFYILFHKNLTASPYEFYIRSIPKEFTNPFFCSKEELYFLPDNILEKIVVQNNEIKAGYEYLMKVVNVSYLSLSSFKWAYFAVNSRCVYIDPKTVKTQTGTKIFGEIIKDEPRLALAPFLDLLNHSDEAVTIATLSENSEFYELYTKKPYKRYEQAFISYGDLNNTKLLVEYGFIIKQNRHDFFEISLGDLEALAKADMELKCLNIHRNKFRFIKDHSLDTQLFVNLTDGPSHNLSVVLYLLFIEKSYFPNVLNQVAFSSSEFFENVANNELRKLVLFKIVQYQDFVKGLNNLTSLSESAEVVVDYLNECIRYLREFVNKFLSN